MPEQSHNESEELLKRYAKERREQGGDFSLHPATRRLLQGEVIRTYGAGGGARRSELGWFALWRGRLAFGTVALVAAGALALSIFWNKPHDGRRMELAKADTSVREQEAGFAAKAKDAPTATVRPAPPAARPAFGNDRYGVALGVQDLVAPSAQPGRDQKQEARAEKAATVALAARTDTLSSRSLDLTRDDRGAVKELQDKEQLLAQKPAEMREGLSSASAGGGPGGSRGALAPAGGADRVSLNYQDAAPGAATLGAKFAASPNRTVAEEKKKPADKVEELARTAPVTSIALSDTRAAGSGASVNSRSFSVQPTAPSVTAPVAPPAAFSPPAERYYRSSLAETTDGLNRAETALSNPVVRVLTQFTIEQSGDTVRVVDADGSIYIGQVEAPVAVESGFDPGPVPLADEDAALRQRRAKPVAEPAPQSDDYSFRASGTNLTLRQPVLFVGHVTVESHSAARNSPDQKGFDGTVVRAPAPAGLQKTTTLRRSMAGRYGYTTNVAADLEGTLRIGTTNQQWFRATRAQP